MAQTPQQRDFWNTVYEKETMKFRRDASTFVQHAVEGRAPGRALDLGMGQVTGVDFSDVAIAEAKAAAELARIANGVRSLSD